MSYCYKGINKYLSGKYYPTKADVWTAKTVMLDSG